MKSFHFCLILLWALSFVQSLNILFYVSVIGKSHLDFTDSLIDTLVDRGHTVVSPDFIPDLWQWSYAPFVENIMVLFLDEKLEKEKYGLKDLVIARFNSLVTSDGKSKAHRIFSFGFKGESPWVKMPHLNDPFAKTVQKLNEYKFFLNVTNGICDRAFSDDGPTKFVSERKYDVALASDYDFCGIAIAQLAKIPSLTTFTSTPILPLQMLNTGLPSPASIIQTLMDQENLEEFTGRLRNMLRLAAIYFIQKPAFVNEQNKRARAVFGEEFEDLGRAAQNADLVFINSNEILEQPIPISHKIKYIGGINIRTPKPVDEKMDAILSMRPKGTVLFCFGTQVPGNKFPLEVKQNMLKAFAKFPDYTILWKYDMQPDDDQLFAGATNVEVVNWLPQTDLLNDQRVVGFISHMGLNSFTEASYAGVPIVAIALFADQHHNAESGRMKGTTYVLDKTALSVKNVVAGLDAVLHDNTYRDNARRVKKMLLEKPEQPKESFVRWIEFVAANPGLHEMLNLPGVDMNPITYYCIDVIVLVFLFLLVVCYLSWKLFTLLSCIFSRLTTSLSTKKFKSS